jgi:hypothetical protein
MTSGTHTVNLFKNHTELTPTSTRHRLGITSLRSKSVAYSSEGLTIITTGVWDASVSTDGSHSSKVKPECGILIYSMESHVYRYVVVIDTETQSSILLVPEGGPT